MPSDCSPPAPPLRLETYIEDATHAGDSEFAELFHKAQADNRKGAEMSKQALRSRLTSGHEQAALKVSELRAGPQAGMRSTGGRLP